MKHTFAGLNLSAPLEKSLYELGYEQPTPIQQQAIPLIAAGKDVVGQAQTGSGKTAAYGLPILQHIDASRSQVQALVIVPTRELVLQVREELKKLGKYISALKILAVYGGHSFSEERKSFSHPPQVLIATPGRLLDHLNRAIFEPEAIQLIVIDEADKLLEMNFEQELNQILSYLPSTRQSLLFSATLPESVLSLIKKTLNNPQFVISDERANPSQIEFIAHRVTPDEKLPALLLLLSELEQPRAVIFCNTRERVNEVNIFLKNKGFSSEALHGAMDQMERDKALMKFRNGSAQLLVATDLAARGIHIAELGTVIHLEILREESSFLHRSGRTGRVGQEGTVYLFVSETEEAYMQRWQQVKAIPWRTLKTAKRLKSRDIVETASPEYITLHVKAGKKEKVSAGDIVGALVALADLQATQIGKIEVHDHFCYVAVPFQAGKSIAEKLNAGKIKGRKIKVSVVR